MQPVQTCKNELPYRLAILALVVSTATFLVDSLHTYDRSADEIDRSLSFAANYGWIAAQSFAVSIPVYLMGHFLAIWLPHLAWYGFGGLLLTIPAIAILDVLAFSIIGERFFSSAMWQIGTTLLPSVIIYVTWRTIVNAIVCSAVVVGFFWMAVMSAKIVGRRWRHSEGAVNPLVAMTLFSVIAMVISIPALLRSDNTFEVMRDHSTRHPFCTFLIVKTRSVGYLMPAGEAQTLARLRGLHLLPAVIDKEQRLLSVGRNVDIERRDESPVRDVVIIIAESIRPELIDEAIMPNLTTFAQKSLWCQNHFSAGNSTKMGMFGLLNGIEATWFDRLYRTRPILNYAYRNAGYEVGFFTGKHNWQMFDMDGFIRHDHFDVFHETSGDWLTADVEAVSATIRFLNREGEYHPLASSKKRPRLAVLYLYVTHIPFFSLPQDEVFKPFAVEDFSIPFSHTQRPEVWNRYKNSARTLDRLIHPLLRDDAVIVFAGDHGESFLEDDCICHGSRMSRYQTMTPLIMHLPDQMPRVIKHATMHFDMLPTLIAASNLSVADANELEGANLLAATDQSLANRFFGIRNYLTPDFGIVGPWSLDVKPPFLYRCLLSFTAWQVSPLESVDEKGLGLEQETGMDLAGENALQNWLSLRLGDDSVDNKSTADQFFARLMRSSHSDIRYETLRIAKQVASPTPELLKLVSHATLDPDERIRRKASETLVILQKRTHASR